MANIKRANASGITKSGTAISDVPDAPTIGAVSDLGTGSTASVAYTAATTGGAATTFTATSSPDGLTGTGSSPITVSGLTAGTAYTFTVTASNTTGSTASAASSSLTLAAVGVFESIASATGTGSSGTITFSSIPATYKHLQIRMIGKITGTGFYRDDLYLRLNGDTGGNYSRHQLQGDGTTASAGGAASATYIDCGRIVSSDSAISNVMFTAIIDIQNYDSTTINKTVRIFSGADANLADSSFRIWLGSGAWLNTSAVNSITLRPASSESFTTTTSVALYGIKGA